MNKSTSRQVSMAKLERQGPLGVILIRLMMSISDLTLASQALGFWNDEDRPAREGVKRSARMYFIRLQIAHLYEGLKIIGDIKADHLSDVERCDQQTRGAFALVAAYLDSDEYEKIAGCVRNNVTFHYQNSKQIARALKAIAEKHPEKSVWISRGRDLHHYNYEPATWAIDQIMLRQIFKIKVGVNESDAADEVVGKLFGIQTAFSDFAVHFIDYYV